METIDLNDTVTVELTEWGAVYLNALKQFREELDLYVHVNHYDDEADDICSDWQLNHYEIAKKVLEELKNG